ncbi:hypothetical protein [Solimicrobium silvestre]|uniref:Sel1 repeat n=1 Tax=Solimicrobium silvestre TaxID=2099400 RepID=A0A2S9H3K3_9BURK|nr:hypothetical protein [Solimicrobium silvestre]PRC94513.1 hypothetical protein S2091_0516 [Solimicrobium silvestre]
MKSKSKPLATITISATLLAVLIVGAGSYWSNAAPTSPTSVQVALQTSPEKPKGQQWFSVSKGSPPVANRESRFMDADGAIVDLNGLTVSQYVNTLYDAANKGDKKAAYNIYKAESICESITPMQQNMREMSAANDPNFFTSIEASINDVQAICADLNSGTRERLNYLLIAAKGGVAPAAIAYAFEPPEGFDAFHIKDIDLADPRVIQWQQDAVRYLTQSATQGNVATLNLLSGFYANGQMAPKNLQLALTYEIASLELRNENLKNEFITKLSDQLTLIQVNAATTSANQLVNSCCNKHAF